MFRVRLPTCVHTSTHPHTNHQKEKKNTCEKNTCFLFRFGGGIPAGACCTAGGTLTPPPPFSSLLHFLPRAA